MLSYSYELFSLLAPHPKNSRYTHSVCVAKLATVFVVLLLVLGCATGEGTSTPLPTQPQPAPTATATAVPTAAPTPTATPTPFPTPPLPTPTFAGQFRAQDLEIAATFQLTHSDEIIYRFSDVSKKGELAVSAYPAVIDGAFETACGLWLLSPETGQVQEISKGILSYPWGALFSPEGDRIIYAATEECPSASAQSHEEGMWLLDLRTMETTTLYESEALVLRGWAHLDIFLAMRHVPDVGWTYRIIRLDGSSERVVPNLALEYQGLYLFTDRPSPRGDLLLLVDQNLTSSFNSELSLVSLITGSPIGEPWQGWPHPSAGDSHWSPDNRSLLYLVAGSIQEGMPIDLMTLDVETGEHTPILSGLSPREDPYIPQAWSPDSRVVLLLSKDRTALHAVNVDGSGFGEVAGSTLSAPKSNYRGVRWSRDGGYLFFHRDPPLPRGGVVTTMETEIWAAVVRLPGESDADLQERVRQLQAGPWPVYLQPSAP